MTLASGLARNRETPAMELTIESALSPGGLLGHLTYLLLVLSMALKRLLWIRVLVMASAVVGICYSFFMLHDPVGVFWESLLLSVNVLRLSVDHLRDRVASFSTEDRAFVDQVFPTMSPSLKRRLLDAGQWLDCPAAMILSHQGVAVTHLSWLSQGSADVEVDGERVSRVGRGELVGELTVLDGDCASATVRLAGPARLWRIEAAALRRLAQRRPEIRTGLDAAFTAEMRRKLMRGAPERRPSMTAVLALG